MQQQPPQSFALSSSSRRSSRHVPSSRRTLSASDLYPIVKDLTEAEYGNESANRTNETTTKQQHQNDHHQHHHHSFSFDLPQRPSVIVNPSPLSLGALNNNTTIPRTTALPPPPPTLRRSVTAPFRFSPSIRLRGGGGRKLLAQCPSQDSSTVCTDVDDLHATSSSENNINEPLSFDEIYVLTRPIWHGHLSTVWECIQRSSGSRFAVKMLDKRRWTTTNNTTTTISLSEEEQFGRREAQILQSLSTYSTNTYTLMAETIFESSKHCYLVTEFCAGGNLTTAVLQYQYQHHQQQQQHQPAYLPEPWVQHLTRSLLRGVAFLHDRGICHHQLSPDNLLLTAPLTENTCKTVQIKIADFGLAVQQQSKHHTTTRNNAIVPPLSRLSNPAYAAPELLQRTAATATTTTTTATTTTTTTICSTLEDMWSVGACIYFMLTGNPPFVETTSRRKLIQKIVAADYDLTSFHHLSRCAKQLVTSLMHVNPQIRLDAHEALEHKWLEQKWLEPTVLQPTTVVVASKKKKTTSSSSGDRYYTSWMFWKCKQPAAFISSAHHHDDDIEEPN